jgi:hypothetical protein
MNYRPPLPVTLVRRIAETLAIPVYIETGTLEGEGAAWASQIFPQVYSIELSETLHKSAAARYASVSNIKFLHGPSPLVLREVLVRMTTPCMIFLDAHWCMHPGTAGLGPLQHECPLLAELAVINSFANQHCIMVHDARLFLAPPIPPHRVEHWPDLVSVVGELSPPGKNRFVVDLLDTFVAVPESARSVVVNFIREQFAAGAMR